MSSISSEVGLTVLEARATPITITAQSFEAPARGQPMNVRDCCINISISCANSSEGIAGGPIDFRHQPDLEILLLVALVLMYAKRVYPPPAASSDLLRFRPSLGHDMRHSLPKIVRDE